MGNHESLAAIIVKRAGLIAACLLGVALLFAVATLWVVMLPWRILVKLYLPRRAGRTHSKVILEALVGVALGAFGYRLSRGRLTPAWRPCENCGAAIDYPSRAAYCSAACRRDANIRQRAALEGVASYD